MYTISCTRHINREDLVITTCLRPEKCQTILKVSLTTYIHIWMDMHTTDYSMTTHSLQSNKSGSITVLEHCDVCTKEACICW